MKLVITCENKPAAPNFSVPGGDFNAPFNLTITSETSSTLKYTTDGYKKYYPEIKDQEKMIFVPKKDSFDNCIIISYEEEDSSSLEKIQWLYKGQVNKVGLPHGFGEKIFKTGKKMVGYFKDGEI